MLVKNCMIMIMILLKIWLHHQSRPNSILTTNYCFNRYTTKQINKTKQETCFMPKQASYQIVILSITLNSKVQQISCKINCQHQSKKLEILYIWVRITMYLLNRIYQNSRVIWTLVILIRLIMVFLARVMEVKIQWLEGQEGHLNTLK